MASQDGYGAAAHEAGHVVLAWALGLKTRKMTVHTMIDNELRSLGRQDGDATLEGIVGT
jgi:hypothetical protein